MALSADVQSEKGAAREECSGFMEVIYYLLKNPNKDSNNIMLPMLPSKRKNIYWGGFLSN